MTDHSPDPQQHALRSVFTSSFAEVLAQLNLSLAVTTYQAGKVVLVRCDTSSGTSTSPAGQVNTHFRSFDRPMGLAVNANRLSIGGANTVWEFRNVPGVAAKLDPPGRHDACYLPRGIHITGDIDIHEMGWSGDNELWLVNTRFGCLCTLDVDHSFSPRWRPPFVSALAPEDRCHLNGLAMVDGRPKYVTALGETDSEGGWRANKANGGILMDVEHSEIVLRELSMPHSPRWYNGKLWVLESGEGSLCVVDPEQGTWRAVAEVPGFTRGLDFFGPLAFIGLSKVRESATFSGIPIVSRLKERTCGVWVVNIETGETVAFLRFESGVEEIFAVQILPGVRYPEMLEWGDPHIASSYVLPDAALADVVLPTEEELARSPAAQFKRGIRLLSENQPNDGIAALRECVRLQPDFPNARLRLGMALADNDAFDEAATLLEQVGAIEDERADVRNALGIVYRRQQRSAEAIDCFEQSIRLQPDYAEAHMNLGVALLQSGRYRRGWREFEWRWKTPTATPFQCPHPRWDGKPIHDRTLLLHTGNDVGEALLFARYIGLAAERCGNVILVCREELDPIFAALPGVNQVRRDNKIALSEFDTWLPLSSLPSVFSAETGPDPGQVPYVDAASVRRRKDEHGLGIAPTPWPKIGIVWSPVADDGDSRHRACPLAQLSGLLKTPGFTFYGLQTGNAREEMAAIPADVTLSDLGDRVRDYGDLAVLVDQLDLLITVDAPAAHVAGAMNKPVWLLLSALPDWQWGLTGDTTPWYPSMRLARQQKLGDWSGAVAQLAGALEHLRDGAMPAADPE